MSFPYTYNFPALKGIQAQKEYFVAMCPLHLVNKIFLFDEEEIPVEHRAQRILNKNRIPELTNYIVDNLDNYVFSSITASVDGEIDFIPYCDAPSYSNLGTLKISMDSKILINDGQHRRAAIENALKIEPSLADETISVVFFQDRGLHQSQQIFSDLNLHAINTTASIGILYDQRDPLAILTKKVVTENTFLKRYTDFEQVSLSKNSTKVLALNFIYNTNKRLTGKRKGNHLTTDEKSFVMDFWRIVCDTIVEWKQVFAKELTPRNLRLNYIVGHSVFVEALGTVGFDLKKEYPDSWKSILSKLDTIDWGRRNEEDWLGRVFNKDGRIQKNNKCISDTAKRIKHLLLNN